MISDPMKAKEADSNTETNAQVFPSCAVTRAKARELKDCEEMIVNLADTFMSHLPGKNIEGSSSHAVPSCSLENDCGMNERDKLIVTGFTKTDLKCTFSISRNTDLKY